MIIRIALVTIAVTAAFALINALFSMDASLTACAIGASIGALAVELYRARRRRQA